MTTHTVDGTPIPTPHTGSTEGLEQVMARLRTHGTLAIVVEQLVQHEHKRHTVESGIFTPFEMCTDTGCREWRLFRREAMP